MHLSIELERSADGQFVGTVETVTRSSVAFSGTLELLKVLQDVTDDSDSRGDHHDS